MKLRCSQEIEIVEILGPLENRKGSCFSLSGADPDLAVLFKCKIKTKLQNNSKIHFQLATLFNDTNNHKILRILNYTIKTTNEPCNGQ